MLGLGLVPVSQTDPLLPLCHKMQESKVSETALGQDRGDNLSHSLPGISIY